MVEPILLTQICVLSMCIEMETLEIPLLINKKKLYQNENRAKEVPCPFEASSSHLQEVFTHFLQEVLLY